MSDVVVTAVGTLICFAPLPAHCPSPYTQAEGSRANELLAQFQQRDPPLRPRNHHPTPGTEQLPALNPPFGVPALCHPQHAAGLPLLPANPLCRLERGSGVGSERAERRRRGAEAGRSSSHAPSAAPPPPAWPRPSPRGPAHLPAPPPRAARQCGEAGGRAAALCSAGLRAPPCRRPAASSCSSSSSCCRCTVAGRWPPQVRGWRARGQWGEVVFWGGGEGRTFGCAGKSSLRFGCAQHCDFVVAGFGSCFLWSFGVGGTGPT